MVPVLRVDELGLSNRAASTHSVGRSARRKAGIAVDTPSNLCPATQPVRLLRCDSHVKQLRSHQSSSSVCVRGVGGFSPCLWTRTNPGLFSLEEATAGSRGRQPMDSHSPSAPSLEEATANVDISADAPSAERPWGAHACRRFAAATPFDRVPWAIAHGYMLSPLRG